MFYTTQEYADNFDTITTKINEILKKQAIESQQPPVEEVPSSSAQVPTKAGERQVLHRVFY